MAYEDLTSFTEVDVSGYWSQTLTRNTATSLPYSGDDSYVYKDYGVDHFGDYIFDIDVKVTTGAVTGVIGVWAVNNSPGSYYNHIRTLDGQLIYLYIEGASKFRIYLHHSNTDSDFKSDLDVNTTYYLRIFRIGNEVVCKIFDSAQDRDYNIYPPLDTLRVTGTTTKYRYLQCGFSQDYTSGGSSVSGYSENFSIIDPNKNYGVKLWDTPTVVSGNGVFIDSSGHIHVAGWDGGGSSTTLYYAVSTDNGSTFTDGEGGGSGTYKSVVTGIPYPTLSAPAIVVDSSDNVYIFYADNNKNLYFVKKTGVSWGSATLIGDHARYAVRAEIDDDDNLIVVSITLDGSNRYRVCFTSVDGGSNWVEEIDSSNFGTYQGDLCLGYNQHLWWVIHNSAFSTYKSRIHKITKTEGSPDSWVVGSGESEISGSNFIYDLVITAERDSETIWAFQSRVVSGDNRLEYNKKSGGSWSGWTTIINNSVAAYSNLQVVRTYNNEIYLIYNFYAGRDLRYIYYDGAAWIDGGILLHNAFSCNILQPNLGSGENVLHFTYEINGSDEQYYHQYEIPEEVTEDIDTKINTKKLELKDTDADIRFLDEIPIYRKIQTKLYTHLKAFKDILSDIRFIKGKTDDVDVDFRSRLLTFKDLPTKFNTTIQQLADADFHIRYLKQIRSDIDINLRFLDEIPVLRHISSDIRFFDAIPILRHIQSKLITIQGQYSIHGININEIYVENGRCHGVRDIKIILDIDNATHMRFKNGLFGSWSAWEPYSTEKEWTLDAGDGEKKIYYWFKNDDGYTATNVFLEVYLQEGDDTFPTISAKTEEGGAAITEGVWQTHDKPYFYFRIPTYDYCLEGYSIAMDGTPDNVINIEQTDMLVDGFAASKGTGNWDIDVPTGRYYSALAYREIEDTTTITLNDPDATFDRYDIIYLDLGDDTIKAKEGVPSATPQEPEIYDDEIQIAKVFVQTGHGNLVSGDITDLRDFNIGIITYTETSIGAGNHYFRIKGIGPNNIDTAVEEFNIKVSSLSPNIEPIKCYKTSAKSIIINEGQYTTITNSPYITWEDPNVPDPGVVNYYITTDGTEPSATNFQHTTTNLYFDFTGNPFAEGTHYIKVRARDALGTYGITANFTFVYGVSSIDAEEIILIANGTKYKQVLKEVQVHEISFSLEDSRSCIFSLPIKFDANSSINNNDEISVYYKGILLFYGWVREKRPRLETSGERMTFKAIGPRTRLKETYWTKNGSPIIEYDAEVTTESRFVDVLTSDNIGGIVNTYEGTNLLDKSLEAEKFTAITMGAVLDSLIQRSGPYRYYIDPFKHLKVIDTQASNPYNLYFGVENESISAHKHDPHQVGDYQIVSSDMNFNITNRYNKIIIVGAKKQYQGWFGCVPLSWDEDEGENPTRFRVGVASGVKLLGNLYAPLGSSAKILAKWRRPIQINLTDDRLRANGYVEYKHYSKIVQGGIDTNNNTVNCGVYSLYFKGYSVEMRDFIYSASLGAFGKKSMGHGASYEVKDEWCTIKPATVRVYTAFEVEDRIKVEVSGTGPVDNTLYIVDESYKYQHGYRDDSGLMTEHADELLKEYKNVKISGQVVLDQIYPDIDLDKTINFKNTAQGGWESINATIQSITFDFDSNTTSLSLTTEYLG